MQPPTLLIVLDGFGFRRETNANAIANAHTPTIDYLTAHYPHTFLKAHGQYVGQLPGFMGNSEVGHLTIGSGRIVDQPVTRMHKLIQNNGLAKHPVIKQHFTQLAKAGGTVHLMGLLSDAGVHSHMEDLFALIETAQQHEIQNIALDCFLDGRDSPPQSAATFLTAIDEIIKKSHRSHITIASLCGRFYAMDRNKEWNRTKDAYTMLTTDTQPEFTSWQQTLDHFYTQNITDEFIPPTRLIAHTQVRDNDGIVFFNFRPDRARQLADAFTATPFDHFTRKKLSLAFFITPVAYDTSNDRLILLEPQIISDCLMDVLCAHGLRTYAIAETEKYAHVTYFFNGGRETPTPCEERVLIPSITTTTYVDLPCMSAPTITQTVCKSLESNQRDFYLINYANADMVGHSGNYAATVRAIECLDKQIAQLYEQAVRGKSASMYICGDHGNAEEMIDTKTGQAHTQHTINPTPFIAANPAWKDTQMRLPLSQVCQIAPFILRQLGMPIPPAMCQLKST